MKMNSTYKRPIIKIFVSHRIDKDCDVINNPFYVNVRCGAIYDQNKGCKTNVDGRGIIGDNTGDNISYLRDKFCELTVHYWAWKNEKADYYGLCHYRRFISFSETKESNDVFNSILESSIDSSLTNKYNLSPEFMEKEICNYDVISIIPYTLKRENHQGAKNIYESLEVNPSVFPLEAVDLFQTIFKTKYPNFALDVDEYFKGNTWRGFNCYILKKEYFEEYSSILFDILFELERRLDSSSYNQEQMRVFGYMGEIAFGIYFNHLKRLKKGKLTEKQLIRIEHPEKKIKLYPAFGKDAEIPIVVSSSNAYAPFLAVLVRSIEENAGGDHNYDIIVLEDEITDQNKRKVLSLIEGRANINLRFVPAKRYLEKRNFYTAMHVTEMTYLRLAIVDILSEFDKAIYLDCDIVVNRDLALLFQVDLKDNYLGAAVDTIMAGFYGMGSKEQANYNEKFLSINKPELYFNAGVLLMNLREIRESFSGSDLLEIASEREWKWFDQDVLNKISLGRVLFLNQKWNVMVQSHSGQKDLTEFYAPLSIYNKYKESLLDPWIVHYAGHFIPCYSPDVDCGEYFWKYAQKTPFYHSILSIMMQSSVMTTMQGSGRPVLVKRIVNRLFPINSRRRLLLKKIVPKGSVQWKILKALYHH